MSQTGGVSFHQVLANQERQKELRDAMMEGARLAIEAAAKLTAQHAGMTSDPWDTCMRLLARNIRNLDLATIIKPNAPRMSADE